MTDPDGYIYSFRSVAIGFCGGYTQHRIELWRWKLNAPSQRVAFLEERCDANQCMDQIRIFGIALDRNAGVLYINYQNSNFHSTLDCEQYSDNNTVIRLRGLTTQFDVLQSFIVDPGTIGFRVPFRPDALAAADYFDTYYGDLATVGDWSQAQPLQCGYPVTPPEPGDYLTVDDTLPDPAPGEGRYYISAVNYQGQRRYGRKSEGGVLNGRDPAVLPTCE